MKRFINLKILKKIDTNINIDILILNTALLNYSFPSFNLPSKSFCSSKLVLN